VRHCGRSRADLSLITRLHQRVTSLRLNSSLLIGGAGTVIYLSGDEFNNDLIPDKKLLS
jgi:hypothetical protein